MATNSAAASRAPVSLAPTGYDKFLAAGAVLLLAIVLVALGRGAGEWARLPWIVWAHLLTILVALALTPVMMLRRRGDRLHRRLGWLWAAAMFLTAALSFAVRTINPGQLSLIHILSAWTLLQVPLIVLAARRHNLRRHRNAIRAMATGALLVAGIFTLVPDRLLGHWLYGRAGSESSGAAQSIR
ncbi:MAG: hypothetical protein QOJ91_207 [Sphingomonadales bacterium]|nr:hypothetical protein [Sphingomonadales bacterium]